MLTYTVRARQLQVDVLLIPEMGNSTEGLLGNFNGDPDDDLLPQGGAVALSPTASTEDIYNLFGETCKNRRYYVF